MNSSRRRYRSVFPLLIVAFSASAGTVVTPESSINALTHTFGHYAPVAATTAIEDGPVDGQFGMSSFSAKLTGTETVVTRLHAPAGKKFVIHSVPAGYSNITLTVWAEWTAGSDVGHTPTGASTTFEGLVGPAPILKSSSHVTGGAGKWIRFEATYTPSPGVEFTAVTISADYTGTIANPTNCTFTPLRLRLTATVSSSEYLNDGILMTMEDIPPRPRLLLAPFSPGAITLQWPTNFADWTLQATTELGLSNAWFDLSPTRSISGTNFLVTEPVVDPARWYRLRH
jgi:hypothetical protein